MRRKWSHAVIASMLYKDTGWVIDVCLQEQCVAEVLKLGLYSYSIRDGTMTRSCHARPSLSNDRFWGPIERPPDREI